jgi:hypothetical protein
MSFVEFRESFPRLSCVCGHPAQSHSLKIELHTLHGDWLSVTGFWLASDDSHRTPRKLQTQPSSIAFHPVLIVWLDTPQIKRP